MPGSPVNGARVLGFVAMEPPTSLDARHLRAEAAKFFDAVKPVDPAHVVRGQYTGYTSEPRVSPGDLHATIRTLLAAVIATGT